MGTKGSFKKGERRPNQGGTRANAGAKPKEVNALRKSLFEENEDDIRLAYDKLMEKVRAGDMDAIKMRLEFAFGKPRQAADVNVAGTMKIVVEYDDE